MSETNNLNPTTSCAEIKRALWENGNVQGVEVLAHLEKCPSCRREFVSVLNSENSDGEVEIPEFVRQAAATRRRVRFARRCGVAAVSVIFATILGWNFFTPEEKITAVVSNSDTGYAEAVDFPADDLGNRLDEVSVSLNRIEEQLGHNRDGEI